MLGEIKKELIETPEKLKDVLEYFDYCNIVVRRNYIQFGRNKDSSPKSIVIQLKNNDWCWVNDYARNINKDIFSYISIQRCIPFVDVVKQIKNILGIDDYYSNKKPYRPFGGFYDSIYQPYKQELKIYDESILSEYVKCPNLRFLKDHISLKIQKEFDIRFDVVSQAIVIPVRDEIGRLVGVKERFNYDVEQGEMKYFYSYPCNMSQVLYGFSQNYTELADNKIYIFEAEKSVMQAASYGIKNCVALGSGSLSSRQSELIMSLHPRQVIFMHDVGYAFENIVRNMEKLSEYVRFSGTEIGYWDYSDILYENKVSPTDMGKDMFEYIIANEIKEWKGAI